jgi:hypothetical protein
MIITGTIKQMKNRCLFTTFSAVLGLMLCVPFIAKSGTIYVNGTCDFGSCPTVDSLADGQSASAAFSFNVAVNGDTYNVAGAYSASYSSADGSTISVNPVITYTGALPTAQSDIVTFDLLQDYYDPSCCTWAGIYSETVPLDLNAPAGSTISGQILYDGVTVGLAGPYGPGDYVFANSANLDFGALDGSATLAADFNMVAQFAAGTETGAGAESPTPEPATAIPCALGLILYACYDLRRRNRSQNAA